MAIAERTADGVVGLLALAMALTTGAVLVYGRPWDSALTAAAVAAGSLVGVTATGIVQARRMTRLRRRALHHPDDMGLAGRVRRGARVAGALRALIGVISLALVALGAVLAT